MSKSTNSPRLHSDIKLAAAIQIQSIARGHATRKKLSVHLKGSKNYDGRGHELAVGNTGWSIHYAPPEDDLPARSYWHHAGSNLSVWEEPTEAVQFREATSVNDWTVHPSPDGEAYWFNNKTKESVSKEPKAMQQRREEYYANTESNGRLKIDVTKMEKNVTFQSPSKQNTNSPFHKKSSFKLRRIPTMTADTHQTTVVSVLARLRILAQDEDPREAFQLFALTGHSNNTKKTNKDKDTGEFIPVSVFAASIKALCPSVQQPLALATARVFDRGQSGLVSEKIFREIIFDRSELSRSRVEAVHQQILILLDELRDVLATTISDEDGARGYSTTELKRHYNNMKLDKKHQGISRGRFVQVMKELDISDDR